MNYSKLIDIYYKLPEIRKPRLVKKIYNKVLEKAFNLMANIYIPNYFLEHPCPSLDGKPLSGGMSIVASLTSFPGRIGTTHLSIQSILRQSIKPNRIQLWLAESQFPNREKDLPTQLLDLKKNGLEIFFCEDLRSHKKYYYALKDNKGEHLILFDDDLFFHKDVIKNLLEIHKMNPNCIVGTRVHRMTFKKTGVLDVYKNWDINFSGDVPSIINHSNSGHGTLIPSTIKFDNDFFDKELFMRLSPNSDDVWFKVNLIRLGIPVVTNAAFARDTLSIKGTYKNSLVSNNTHKGMKDKQFKAVFEYFGIEPMEQFLTP